jgi:sarcosine oxidase subunit alpha
MSQSHRLESGGRIDRSKPIDFSFNGKTYRGYQGDTLASALLGQGVHFVARSWKYHRPRGILTAGVEEPNALVQLEKGASTVPNPRATEIELYSDLTASSVNASPSVEGDRMAFLQRISRFIPAGFYYKTFMWPRKYWPKYEERIREAAGLGVAPSQLDPGRYEKSFAHCDVLVVGAGPSGLAAAYAAAKAGARVMLVDNRPEPGGSLLAAPTQIAGVEGMQWVQDIVAELRAHPDVRILTRATAFGYHHHNFVTVCHRLTDHLPVRDRNGVRERVIKVRPGAVVLATGAHERPMIFGNNDLPGIMLASAVSTYINQYGVLPGRNAVVFANNDEAYRTALDLHRHGAKVVVVDPRPQSGGTVPAQVKSAGIAVMNESVVIEASGKQHVRGVRIVPYQNGKPGRAVTEYRCDLLAMSGGFNPAVHLFAQSGGKARWDDARACFVPDRAVQPTFSAGAANGDFALASALSGGLDAARAALDHVGIAAAPVAVWETPEEHVDPLMPLWFSGHKDEVDSAAKQFVDYQNDVAASDIHLAVREGYESIEHVKRYTALGFGTDQGKLGNINGMAILADVLGQSIPETGTTTYRPNYTPVSFGAAAGREVGDFLTPIRKTCLHEWNAAQGAPFEDVGNWKRAWYFPRQGEDMHAAVAREVLAVRGSVGIMDSSTLGKIDIQGPDTVEFLNHIYTNSWTKLAVGKCRYGLMMDENGMVFDDGVNIRLGQDHFLLSTTSGGAARVMAWMERWHQTEWPHLKVHMTSVTDHFATFAVVGPKARKVVSKVCEGIDFADDAFPFMSFRDGTALGAFARVMRISFSGERSYEVNVPANYGQAVWDALMEAGREYDITPYGTETMHVLRAEKGYIIVGQDTDGSVTPFDLGMGGLVSKLKDCIGKRSLTREHTGQSGRKQFVGLLTDDPARVLPEGAQIVERESNARPVPMMGHVTSSYKSPTLSRSIALALLKGGLDRHGEKITVALPGGGYATATVCSPVFYDPEGARQNAAD